MPEFLPKITVVSPSYNQAQFIEQTILSVIGQEYPNLEYIIMDGGSNDGSADIIKKYEQHLKHWQSKKDNGQGAAINEGFSMATGDILCWLNSDDMFMPGVLLNIGRLFKDITAPTIVFGNCLHFNEHNAKTRGSDVEKSHKELKLELCDYIIQPSSFWNRSVWEQTGKLNESFHYTFDWEWFIRAKRNGVTFFPLKNYLSLYRIHEAHKSGTGGDKRSVELGEIYRMYSGEMLQKAFMKWNRYDNKYRWFHNIVYACNCYNLPLIRSVIKTMILPSITIDEFKNITRM